jgi:hypothetical protein
MTKKIPGAVRGRPKWDLLKDDDRHLIAFFWATQIHENQFRLNAKATRHAVAMSLAAFELGGNGKSALSRSADNLSVLFRREGKLEFQTRISRSQFESHQEANDIKKRADDILRKARWAMEANIEWTEAMAAALIVAFHGQERESALTLARLNCLAFSEMSFFERSLKPFIIGRFDQTKRVIFSLPDFMPNFV